jgi:hypothetical protein
MAKEDMLCPFSGKLCRECSLYRGRHYYLCFSKKYRGHLEKSEGATRVTNASGFEAKPAKQFEAPVKMPSAIDPFKGPLADIK